jgi:O-antigen ligase
MNPPFLKLAVQPDEVGMLESKDPLSAAVLAIGISAVCVVGAPDQMVLPETIKWVVSAVFAMFALCLFVWRIRMSSLALQWAHAVWVPIGLAVFALLSTLWAPMYPAMADAARWLVFAVIVLLGVNSFGFKSVGTVATAAHFGALIASVLALLEFWLNLTWFPSTASPGATFGNRNFFAELIAVTLPFSFWLLFRPSSTNQKIVQAVGSGLILVALLCTGTRSAILATMLSLLMSFVAIGLAARKHPLTRQSSLHCGIAIAVPLALVLSLGWIPSTNDNILAEDRLEARGLTPIARSTVRIQSMFVKDTYAEKSSFGIRKMAWTAGKAMVIDHPLLGVGAGGWNTASPLYMPAYIDTEHVWMAHNEPVQLVAEYGLLGWVALFALAGLWFSAVRRFFKSVMAPSWDGATDVWPAAVSVAAFMVVALSGMPLHSAATAYLLAVCTALLLLFLPVSGTLVLDERSSSGKFVMGKTVGAFALFLTVVISVQGLRSDWYVQRSSQILAALRANKAGMSPEKVKLLRTEAIAHLRRGLDLYPEHGLSIISMADEFANLSDPESVLWLSQLMQLTRPHVVAVKCNMVRAYSDQGKFDDAEKLLSNMRMNRPDSRCIPISEFILSLKQDLFKEALERGLVLMGRIDGGTDATEARYVVDMSYRSAIRVPDHEAAIKILQFRLQRWPETQSASWTLVGLLLASKSPGKVSEDALGAFSRALKTAANANDRSSVMARIPPLYQRSLD